MSSDGQLASTGSICAPAANHIKENLKTMNDIIELATEEIIDVVLQGADCDHHIRDDVEYSIHPLYEKSTTEEVGKLINKAIKDWLKKFMDEVERQGEARP